MLLTIPQIQFYSNKSIYSLQELVDHHWYDFTQLFEIHNRALIKRTTRKGRELRFETESRLRELVDENFDNPFALEKCTFDLEQGLTDFASSLLEIVEKRLVELEKECFRFPSTETEFGYGELRIKNLAETGLLRAVGYHRGEFARKLNLTKTKRRNILDAVYTRSIPEKAHIDDIEKWGAPNTSQRLRKLVYTIAYLVNQERRNYRGDYELSISDGRSDLQHLKKQYYDNEYDWIYPDVNKLGFRLK